MIVCPSAVRHHAAAAVLDSVLRISEIAAAFSAEGIQGAITEETIECLLVTYCMARKEFTFLVRIKFIILGLDFFQLLLLVCAFLLFRASVFSLGFFCLCLYYFILLLGFFYCNRNRHSLLNKVSCKDFIETR